MSAIQVLKCGVGSSGYTRLDNQRAKAYLSKSAACKE